MKPTGNAISLVLPAAVLAEVEAAADEDDRPVADVLRDLVERGLNERRWQVQSGRALQRTRTLGPRDDDQALTDEHRQIIGDMITQGVRSLRSGDFTDGEAFMAQMDAELAELDQKGQA